MQVCSRLQKIDRKGKSVTLKVMVRKQGAPKETAKFMGEKNVLTFSMLNYFCLNYSDYMVSFNLQSS